SFDKSMEAYEQAAAMRRRLLDRSIQTAPEARALAQIAFLRSGADSGYFSTASRLPDTDASAYSVQWAEKGVVHRLLARRHLPATVQQQSAEIRQQYARLTTTRREIAQVLNNSGRDLAARNRRLAELNDVQERLERDLAAQLPALERDRKLAALR